MEIREILDPKRVVYQIRVDDVQVMARESAGRKLNENEMLHAEKCIGYGLGETVWDIIIAAIKDAVEQEGR